MKLPAEFVDHDGELVEFPMGKDFSLEGWKTVFWLSFQGSIMGLFITVFFILAPVVHGVCFLKKQWNKLFEV